MKASAWTKIVAIPLLWLASSTFGNAAPSIVIGVGESWKYLPDGSNQGSVWTGLNFNDAAWPSGPSQLGYGDGDEATVISSGPDPSNHPITVYFRHKVFIPGPISSATLRLLRDDGAVVYVNGVEVRRDNMPTGPISYNTLASTTVGGADETTYFETAIPTTAFVPGTNVIAVEVHQANAPSSDLSFSLELLADVGPPGPSVTVATIDGEAREIPPFLDIPEDPALFRLTRIGSVSNALNVSIRMSGSASNGVDYDLVGDTVTIPAGSDTADVIIHAIDDTLAEGTESVVLTLVPNACPECYVVGGSSSATASIIDNEPANSPPTVVMLAPADGSKFTAPVDIRLRASASDPEDGYNIGVDFYGGTNRIGSATFLPTLCPSPECPSWDLVWSNVPPGEYSVTARATDSLGAQAVSAPPVHITVQPAIPPGTNITLVSTGSVWKYNDTGTNLGVLWREPVYDDTGWPAGPAQLGYGDGDEATVVGSGPDPAVKNITTYFRRTFQVSDASTISNLNLRVLRDDGVIVYLNGIEVYRNNMPAGPAAYNTLAASVAVDENAYLSAPIARDALVSGANVIAAEIHQVNITSSDIGFDLELTGLQTGGTANQAPIISIAFPTNNAVLDVGDQLFLLSSLHDSDGAAAHATVEVFANTESLGLAQLTDPGPLHDAAFRLVSPLPGPGSYTLRAKATDDRGAVAYSDPVHIRVGPPPATNQPPRIRIVSPLDGALFSAGSNPGFYFEVIVDPPDDNDFEGQLATVEFFADDVAIGWANSGDRTNFVFQWFSIPAGQFTITAKATDFRGLIGFSDPIDITVIEQVNCPPTVQWQTSPGASGYDEFYQVLQLPDGGYIAGGESYSSADEFDYWLVRFNAAGTVLWEKRYGGTSGDQAFDMALTHDGGFIIAGGSRSVAGPRKAAPNLGEYDFWVVRVDANGERLWDRSYGGTSDEFVRSVLETDDGGFILAGESRSEPSVGKTAAHYGDYDVWVVRIDANGNKLWDRSYGGSGQEFWTKVSKTHDGGFVLTATTHSGADGNKSTPGYGEIDGWIVRIDSAGNKLWDQTYGGSENDYLGAALEMADGRFIAAGWSGSQPGGNKTSPQLGGGDGWVLGLNSDGSRAWERSFGGTGTDSFHLLTRTASGDFVVGGNSSSGAELSKTSPTTGTWLAGITGDGEKLWDTSLGNNLIESLHQTVDGGFILGGISFNPGPDGWIIKLGPIRECHPDSDNDGVPDSRDDCPGTVAGDVVNAHGCSIAQLSPCEGPWHNHAEYVRSVIGNAWAFFREGLITAEQRREIERHAAMSSCGRHEVERVCLHLLPLTNAECRAQGVAFLLSGDHAGGCVVETSTDLEHWTEVMTPDGGVTGAELSCPVAHDSAARFYRVRLTP